MPRIKESLPFEVEQMVKRLGANVRTARLRRRMTQDDLVKAAGVDRKTLYHLENGQPGVSLGRAFSVLWALGLLPTAQYVADPDQDTHGKVLEQARLPQRVREARTQMDNNF